MTLQGTQPRVFLALLVLAMMVAVLSAAPATAQTTGAIKGQALDSEGGVMPGVQITASSVSGRLERSVFTGVNGRFTLPSLPVGDYAVRAELEGFQPDKQEGVRVSLGTTTNLHITMSVEAVEEVLNVVATAPVVDLTASSVDTNFTGEFIDKLATDRNFWDMISLAPGMSPTSEGSVRFSAFGSSIQSNSWHIDGLDGTATETGNSWWWINPDTIEEIQVLGIGAPAEYGNMLGAAFNVVTKSGTNQLKGSFNWYHQSDSLTSDNAEINGIPFERDILSKTTAALSGPLRTDNLWFFAAHEFNRDRWSEPGVDPAFPSGLDSDRSDVKLTAALNDSNLLDVKLHYEDYDFPFGDPFATPDATGREFGTNPAWGIHLQSVLNTDNYLEVQYAGYTGEDDWQSVTGSQEPPFIDYSPPDGGPPRYSGSLWYPYLYDLSRDQLDAKLSHHADDLIKGDHDFKFGIAYGQGENDTILTSGPTGVYYYRYEYYAGYPYYYRVTARPYHYGAESDSLSVFADDSWQVTDKMTLNLGVRFDQHNGEVPDYPLLDQRMNPTGETIPGLRDAIDWSLVSPRIGFAYQATDKGVLRGFYGKFFDANVTGNWDAPPPQAPSYTYAFGFSPDGPFEDYFVFEQDGTVIDPGLKAPETDQFTIGWEQQLGRHYSVGAQLVYKDTKNLIGWELLGDGVYDFVPFVNPITGELMQLASIVEQPTRRKGNRPGAGSLAAPGADYNQEYKGLVLTFNKRFSNGWQLMSSYTRSDSEGLIPRPQSDVQNGPFYSDREGSDPNHWLNADQALQGDRENVFQLQTSFNLPLKFVASLVYTYQDGRPFNRQVRARLNQGLTEIIAVPASQDRRFPSQNIADISVGRRFDVGKLGLKLDVQVLNVTNEDDHDFWETLVVPASSNFTPSGFIFPRRVMLRVGIEF